MQKVYRLLHNNKETGPYTLEELLQANIQQHDLIWVEGKSGCWAYPYEVDALKPYFQPPQQPTVPKADHESTARHIFVSLPPRQKQSPDASPPPANLIEQRAEALRQRVHQHTATVGFEFPTEEVKTNIARSLHETEDAYTKWLYEKKTKRKRGIRKYVLTGGLVAAVFTGGLFAGQIMNKIQTLTPQLQGQQSEAVPQSTVAIPTEQAVFVEDENIAAPVDSVQQQQVLISGKKTKKEKQVKTDLQIEQMPEQIPVAVSEEPPQQNSTLDSGAAQETEPDATAPAEQKKKRSGLFGNLFNKRQKKTEAEDGATVTPDSGKGLRKARRRGESAGASATNLAERIELRSSVPDNNWMLGVRGQKITLYNHNTEPVKTVAVEVSYSSEENNLLEKKTIYFSNVAAKGQATAALPDHHLAEKVSFRLLNVSAVKAQ